jgi:HEAT repeat protein
MRTTTRFRWLLAALALCIPPAVVHADFRSDEDLLKQAETPTDTRGLLDFLRRQSPPAPNVIPDLIRKLGSDQFQQREDAENMLLAIGQPALPALEKAAKDPDAEVASRASRCVDSISPKCALLPEQSLLAVRVLLRRAPPGLIPTLVEYLPFVASREVEEVVWFGVDALATKAGKLDPALVAALRDPQPARRALAACLAGRLGDAKQKETVRRLFADKDANVRLRAAQGLLAGLDAAGVETLIALLDQPDAYLAWQAEELLHFLAGPTAPETTVGAGSVVERQRCRKAWETWNRTHGPKADPAEALKRPGRPGLLLLIGGKGPQESIFLFGCQGQARWTLGPVVKIADVQLLAGNRVLLAEDVLSDTVCERDLNGKVVKKQKFDLPWNILDCQRLPNGNTWVVKRDQIQIATPEKPDATVLHLDGHVIHVDRNGSGQAAALVRRPQPVGAAGVVELDLSQPIKDQRPFRVSQRVPIHASFMEALPNGGKLLSGSETGLLVELDRAGKTVWQARSLPWGRATRLPDARTLICMADRIAEVDRVGRVVWEAVQPMPIKRIRTCLNLVRLGFPPSRIDIDQSVAYRVQALQSKEPHCREHAARVLMELGPRAEEALPALSKALADPSPGVREAAAECLQRFGPRAKTCIPALLDALDAHGEEDDATTSLCCLALAGMGPVAQPALVKALSNDPRPAVRAWSANALGILAEECPLPVAELQAALKDRSAIVRLTAVRVLAHPARTQANLVRGLIAALRDRDPEVRREAIYALGEVGPAADVALPLLLKLPVSTDLLTQNAVFSTLGSIGQRDPSVLPLMLAGLEVKREDDLRATMVRSIGRMGANGRPAVPHLIALLQQRKPGAYEAVIIQALGRLAPYDEDALDMVLRQLNNKREDGEERRTAAVAALEQLGPLGKEATPLLIKRLIGKENVLPSPEINTLVRIGPDAVPGLLAVCWRGQDDERRQAIRCLGQMGANGRAAVPVLLETLKKQDILSLEATNALASIGPEARAVIPFLLKQLDDPDGGMRLRAVRALGSIGLGNKKVIQALEAKVEAPMGGEIFQSVRCEAMWSLGLLGPAAGKTVPTLLAELKRQDNSTVWEYQIGRRRMGRLGPAPVLELLRREDFHWDPRGCALVALAHLGPAAQAASPTLLTLCEDRTAEPFERWLALEGLRRIGLPAGGATRLVQVLEEDQVAMPIQISAIRVLAAQGPSARPAVPALSRLALEGQRPVRLAAKAVLDKMK